MKFTIEQNLSFKRDAPSTLILLFAFYKV